MKPNLSRRPLLLCILIMSFFCLVLLVLYHFSEKENTLFAETRRTQFYTLAAEEAEEAAIAWENGSPTAKIYHRIAAAADYLTMAPQTPQTEELIQALRDAGERLLNGEKLTDMELLTHLLERAEPERPQTAPVHEKTTMSENVTSAMLQSRADTLSGTTGLLRPTAANPLVYTCDNVYIRFDDQGMPREMAVYPPRRYEPTYDNSACRIKSGRVLEKILPGFYARPGGTEPIWEGGDDNIYMAKYRWREWLVETEVRRDTGRLVRLRMGEEA